MAALFQINKSLIITFLIHMLYSEALKIWSIPQDIFNKCQLIEFKMYNEWKLLTL